VVFVYIFIQKNRIVPPMPQYPHSKVLFHPLLRSKKKLVKPLQQNTVNEHIDEHLSKSDI